MFGYRGKLKLPQKPDKMFGYSYFCALYRKNKLIILIPFQFSRCSPLSDSTTISAQLQADQTEHVTAPQTAPALGELPLDRALPVSEFAASVK